MLTSQTDLAPEVMSALRRVLYQLASDKERNAASEASRTPYWKPCPDSVIGLRAAARALREAADSMTLARSPIGQD